MGEILPLADLVLRRERLRAEGRTLVWTNGCFDLLHAGHVRYLAHARSLGSALVVGVNADASVRRLKGPTRPINPLADRMEVLAALASVDYVVSFDSDRCDACLEALRPDVFVKAGDYTLESLDPGERSAVERHGGRIVLADFLPGRSTTRMAAALPAVAPAPSPEPPGNGPEKFARVVSAAFALIRNEAGKLLLVASREDDGGLRWGLPGGEQVPGESLEATVRRELREETGLAAASLAYKGTIERIAPECRFHLVLHVYEAALPPGAVPAAQPSDEEVVAHGWFDAEEAGTLSGRVLGRSHLVEYLRRPDRWPPYIFMGSGEE